jgi:REP element-mobilizing transposase RayT
MGQSLVNNYIHLIFSTKNRANLILPEIEEELYKYIGGICSNLDCNPIQIGGTMNHIHLLCTLTKKITLIDFLEEVKSSSSKWIKSKGNKYRQFYWQNGYGSFTVSPDRVQLVKEYILKQKEHHSVKTFQEEYIAILKKFKSDYDENFIWD